MLKRKRSWYKTVRRSGRWTWKSTVALLIVLALVLGGIGGLYAISQGWIE